MTENPLKIEPEIIENPWDVQTVYLFQYFNCPECLFKVQEKQEFINHACTDHPDSIGYFNNIKDGSLEDVIVPYISEKEEEIKVEFESDEDIKDIDTHQDFESSDSEYEEPKSKKSKGPKRTPKPKKVTCSECNRVFSSNSHLKQHFEGVHQQEKKIKCDKCDLPFVTVEDWNQHIIKCHLDETEHSGEFQCQLCHSIFCIAKLLDLHHLITHNKKILTCLYCKKTFSELSNLRRHEKSVHLGNTVVKKKKKHCPFCDAWSEEGTLGDHVKQCHPNEPMPFLCEKCDYKTFTKSNLRMHQLNQHERNNEFMCDRCDYVTKTNAMLQRHINHVHLQIRNFSCDQCPKAFKDRRQLHRHLVTAHQMVFEDKTMESVMRGITKSAAAVKAVESKCDKCDNVTFTTELDMNDHYKRVHDSDSNIKCIHCDSHWHSSQSLNYHIYNSHKASDRYCDICGTFLKNSYYLERHRKQVHFKIHDFICDHCGKSFPFKVTRDNHVNVAHLKALKFPCDKCDYKALTKPKLTLHIRSKHLINDFKCKYCDFATSSPKMIYNHKKKFHT